MTSFGNDDKDQPLRYACDRCHAHKLRCSRADQSDQGTADTGNPCSRCLKARVPCVVGLRGKVGRPAKNTKRKSAGYEGSGATANHGDQRQEQDLSRPSKRNSAVENPMEPDVRRPRAPSVMMLGATSSDATARESADANLFLGLPSPSLFSMTEMPAFPFTPGEMESWEAIGMPPCGFKAPFSPTFEFGPATSHGGEMYFHEPSLTTSESILSRDMDGLESDFETATIRSSDCLGTGSHADDPSGRNELPWSFSPAKQDRQKPCSPASPPPPDCPRSSHERLCELNLRISAAGAGLAENGPASGDEALKGVSSLASELIDAARQIVSQLGQGPSAPPPSPMAEEKGGQSPRVVSSAPSPTAGGPTSSSNSDGRAPRGPSRSAAPDASLVFLLLACYAGLLSALERVLDGLWAQYEDHQGGRGTPSLSSRLERSLAAHTVHCLLALLREALLLQGPNEGGATLNGGHAADREIVDQGPQLGLLAVTCTEIQGREDAIRMRAERFQQVLIRE